MSRGLLMSRDPILYFDEVPLYESELEDNGASHVRWVGAQGGLLTSVLTAWEGARLEVCGRRHERGGFNSGAGSSAGCSWRQPLLSAPVPLLADPM